MTPTPQNYELSSIHANDVKGLDCPACGHPTLMIFDGYITCTLAECPNPDYSEAIEQLISAEKKLLLEKLLEESFYCEDHLYGAMDEVVATSTGILGTIYYCGHTPAAPQEDKETAL